MIVTQQRHRQRGFTMIEMIGVLAVIAILASIVAPKIFDAIHESKVNTFASNIQAIETAVASYYKDTGALPTSANDLITNPNGSVKNWNGPYVDKSPLDMFSTLNATSAVLTTTARGYNLTTTAGSTNSYANKTTVLSLGFAGISVADGKAVSAVIDGDSTDWWRLGRVVMDKYTVTAAPTGTATDLYAFIAAF